MKTKLSITLAALLSTSAMAHNSQSHHNIDASCNVSLEHSVKVTPQFIQVLDGEKTLYRITDDAQLFIEGDKVGLNDQQQALVKQYHALMQELAPQVAELVTQGLALANEAVTTLFGEMFGDDAQMQQKLQRISDKFEQRFGPLMNNDDGEYFLSKEHVDAAGDDLGQELEQEIKGLVKESAGQMLMFIGKMMMSGEGDLNSFEQKMEKFGRDMEIRGKALEREANQMCSQMERLELIETQLQQSIPEFSGYDLVKVEKI